MIIEDIVLTRGATFGTALDRTLTREQAEDLIDVLATFHAAFWERPLTKRFGR